MEKIFGTQQSSVSTILNLLPQSSSIPNNRQEELKVKDGPMLCGDFKAKIEELLQKRNKKQRSIIFENFYYKRIEVGELTGQQFLDLLRAICRDKDLTKPRNCIVISINEKEEAAVVAFGEDWLEITTPPLSGNDRGYYRKLFDDVQCKELAEKYPDEYGEEVLRPLRQAFPNVFKNFFVKFVRDTWEPHRYSCYGLMFEITKLELKHPLYQMMIQLPVAALIWLAVFKRKPQKLQSCFGDHHQSYAEVGQAKSEKKFAIRTKAACFIVAEALPVQQDGGYDDEELKRCFRDIQSFYGIQPQPTP